MDNHPRYRSLFWPILLVGVGLVWLLSNLGMIQPISLGSVLKFWPVLLIVFGLDMLFGRRYPWVGAVVGLLAVAGVVALLMFGPQVGITTNTETKSETFATPLEGVKTADYNFDTSSSPVEISALDDNDFDLISADITYRGTMRFDVSGSDHTTVWMSEYSDNTSWLNWDFSFDNLRWDIGLSPEVPADIVLNGGSGSINMDLTGLQLNSLQTDTGSGSSNITLPQSSESYTVDVESGSGSVSLRAPDQTSFTLTLDTGSGSTNVIIPAKAAVRIEVNDDGSGSLDLPNGLMKTSDSSSFDIGAWQTPNYDTAEYKILVQILGQGSGSISIR
ncbi:MAG: hypothetical protein CVU42_10535 [Chloroflexi bacterium HGW-Chloroflexi-4]|jgi:hypothetical protein|nr:MAG: hypothetical protein CVU42_10535 [Chloroflexi bacterium HGW-Chloroflexi-4]